MNSEDILEMMNQEQETTEEQQITMQTDFNPNISHIHRKKTTITIKIFMINQLLQYLDHYHQQAYLTLFSLDVAFLPFVVEIVVQPQTDTFFA